VISETANKKRKLKNEALLELLLRSHYGILSTVSKTGYPSCLPVSFVYLYNAIYIHSSDERCELENISNNNCKVSFCIVGLNLVKPENFEFNSVTIYGVASELLENEKNITIEKLANKYYSYNDDKGKLCIRNIFLKNKIIKICVEYIQ